jgi:two-component system sensor histidine kinase BaeS
MQEIADRFRPQFASKAVTLSTAFSSLIDVQVCADRERLCQLFSNLLDNSLKYTDAGGRTEIVAETGEDELLIMVQDSAPSVPPEDMKRIFERLYRADISRNRKSGGAGLGLAICRKIVEAHQGSIEATQSPLGGLIITLSLPLMKNSPCPKKS